MRVSSILGVLAYSISASLRDIFLGVQLAESFPKSPYETLVVFFIV
jgi:hypothetical protein